jgi:hypothetical protein
VIIAATSRSPELAGALYPFAWIEDGDFDIPSVYMTDEQGARLAAYVGKAVAAARYFPDIRLLWLWPLRWPKGGRRGPGQLYSMISERSILPRLTGNCSHWSP